MSKSIKKNYIYNVFYNIVTLIIPIVTAPYISRVLTPSGVGQFSFTYSIITYFTIFASLGFGIYAQREIANYQDDKEKQSKVFWEIILCRLATVLISLAINIVLILLNVYGDYSLLMWILCLNIFAIAFDVAFFFQGNEKFKLITIFNTLIKILYLVSIFLFVKDIEDVWIYTLLHCLMTIVTNLGLWLFLKNKICKVSIKELRPFSHFKSSFRLFIPTIAISIYTVLDKTLIGVIMQSDAANGLYEQSEKIVKILLTIITCLGTVMIPRNSNEFAKGNIEKVKQNIYTATKFTWVLGIPIMFGTILISNNFVPWFFGEGFELCSLYMMIFSPLILIMGLGNVIGNQFLLPTKEDKKYTISVTIGAFVNLFFNLILIYLFGVIGAILATVIAELIVTIVLIIFAKDKLDFKYMFKCMIKPLIAGIIMFAIGYPISLLFTSSILNTFIIVGIGIVVYALTILLLKEEFVTDALRKILKKKNKKEQ